MTTYNTDLRGLLFLRAIQKIKLDPCFVLLCIPNKDPARVTLSKDTSVFSSALKFIFKNPNKSCSKSFLQVTKQSNTNGHRLHNQSDRNGKDPKQIVSPESHIPT